MYLKSLVVKGFKSFGEPTEINFEQGVTVIVGPNGSGKSNIVDAVAWVLGAQGPSVVRSSKMEEVIFDGNSRQSALGRAEVTLTIDNSARRLPIDLSEVTLSRILWRNGESEYFINGAACRLLDIQELLSDSGVGRSQHVIISQGQIDAILSAKPEERRAVIEEAAGVLKYRRRKEKAERRLLASQSNLDRIQDMIREVKRQIGPLKKQAVAAVRSAEITSELNTLKIYQSGQELVGLQNRLVASQDYQSKLVTNETESLSVMSELLEKEAMYQKKLIQGQDLDLTSKISKLQSLKEKAKGLIAVISERRRLYEQKRVQVLDEQVVTSLEAEAADLTKKLDDLKFEQGNLVSLQNDLDSLKSKQRDLQNQLDQASLGVVEGEETPISKYNESKARLEGLHSAKQSSEKLLAQLQLVQDATKAELRTANEEVSYLDKSIYDLKAVVATAESEKSELERHLSENRIKLQSTKSTLQELENKLRESQIIKGTIENALQSGMAETGANEFIGQEEFVGILGDFISIKAGYEKAVAAAIGPVLVRVMASNSQKAFEKLLDAKQKGKSPVIVPNLQPAQTELFNLESNYLSAKLKKLSDFVGTEDATDASSSEYDEMIHGLLESYFLYEGELDSEFVDLAVKIGNVSNAIIVTKNGDRFGRDGWYLKADRQLNGSDGSGDSNSVVLTKEALLKADKTCQDLSGQVSELSALVAEIQLKDDQFASLLKEKSFEISKLNFEINTKIEQNNKLKKSSELLEITSFNTLIKIDDEKEKLQKETDLIKGLEESVSLLSQDNELYQKKLDVIRKLTEELSDCQGELTSKLNEYHLTQATLKERRQNYESRLSEIEMRLLGKDEERQKAKTLLESIEIQSQGLASIQELANKTLKLIDNELVILNVSVQANQQTLEQVSKDLESVKDKRVSLERDVAEYRDLIQKQEIIQAETKVKLEHVRTYILNEIECSLDEAMNSIEPPLPPGTTIEVRIMLLEKELKNIGPINALADVELTELESRYDFLFQQLEDIKNARRELHAMIRSIDEEIAHDFESAFTDVKSNYKLLLEVLFPGGSGDLILTEPDHLLDTGIEIEAKPAGRTVKKLSLLSGGERSLVAMAFLFAVFRSRPSPFYLMDEVEAALDDLNLGRFLNLINEFRTTAQLIIVSHQKRTMENADALYGVSMQAGGSTKVVSERLSQNKSV